MGALSPDRQHDLARAIAIEVAARAIYQMQLGDVYRLCRDLPEFRELDYSQFREATAELLPLARTALVSVELLSHASAAAKES